MSVDRSYLPYPSARNYQDRKMKKWLGFFLSEHTAAMNAKPIETLSDEQMDLSEILLLISQSYTNKIELAVDDGKGIIIGTVDTINGNQIGIKGDQAYCFRAVEQIKCIEVAG